MYGIKGINLAWFYSHLANKIQFISVHHGLQTDTQDNLFGVFSIESSVFSIDVFRPFGRPVYRFECPNPSTQKSTFQVFFCQLYFSKKYVGVAINDFTMHLVILKWLRIQICRQQRMTMKLRGRSKIKNCQRKIFYSFNYVIDHVSIRFFFYVNRLHCFV